jgi:hypothetical protein
LPVKGSDNEDNESGKIGNKEYTADAKLDDTVRINERGKMKKLQGTPEMGLPL